MMKAAIMLVCLSGSRAVRVGSSSDCAVLCIIARTNQLPPGCLVVRAVVGGSGATKLSAASGPSLAQAAEEAVYWEEPSLFHHHHNDATAAPGPNSASDCYCGISRGVTGTGVAVTESRLKENCAAVVAIHEVAFESMRKNPTRIVIATTTAATLENVEDEVLPWIYYHTAIGVTDFYIFYDGWDNDAVQLLRKVPHVSLWVIGKNLSAELVKQEMINFGNSNPFYAKLMAHESGNYQVFQFQRAPIFMPLILVCFRTATSSCSNKRSRYSTQSWWRKRTIWIGFCTSIPMNSGTLARM